LIFYSKFLSLQKFILERVIKSILLKKKERERKDGQMSQQEEERYIKIAHIFFAKYFKVSKGRFIFQRSKK